MAQKIELIQNYHQTNTLNIETQENNKSSANLPVSLRKIDESRDTKRSSQGASKNLQYTAYIYSLISNISIVGVQFGVKQLSHYFPAFLVLGIRGTLLISLNFFVMRYNGINLDVKNSQSHKLLIMRSSFSALTMIMYLSPLQFIPIGVAATLFNTGPLMSFFLQALYYKKTSIKWAHVFITLISFIGIVMIIQPEFLFGKSRKVSSFEQILYGVVLIAALTSCMSMIFLHDLRNAVKEHVALQFGYFFQGTSNYMLFIAFGSKFESYEPTATFTIQQITTIVLLFVFLVCSAYTTQYYRIRSMYLSKPSKVMPISYVSVIIGMIVDVTLFNADYNFIMVLGAIFTSCGLLSKLVVQE